MKKLAELHRDRVIDLLNERLVFERTGVQLYDRVMQAMGLPAAKPLAELVPLLLKHREQEHEHEEWLEEQIRALGGDAHAETEHSRLVTLESQGIERVMRVETKLPHLIHAVLSAELVDNAGWQLLLGLADYAGDDEARVEFRKRLREEEAHLILARQVMDRFARQEVLGTPPGIEPGVP